MAQSKLQRLTTNWNWLKGYALFPITTGAYSWQVLMPYFSQQTFKQIAKVNLELSKLRMLIQQDVTAAKLHIKEEQNATD